MGDVLDADYVVVGGGSAGCVLANRLSEDGRSKVILLEAGGDDRLLHNPQQLISNIMITVPIGYAKTIQDPSVNWMYKTEPDAGIGGRSVTWSKGKVLGGSSSINGMLYVRGQREDYDGWRDAGCPGWGWDDVLPYFRKSQNQEAGEDELNGVGGPLNVSESTMRHPVAEAVVEACRAVGLPERDLNGPEQEGVSWFQLTIRNGRRCSASVAYLHPAMHRPNLMVISNALASRIMFEEGRAVGVEYWQGNARKVIRARAEIVLAAGSIASPQILQLSGIGPGSLLAGQGIDVISDQPGIGENLQDHYVVAQNYRLRAGVPSINELTHGVRLLGQGLEYLASRRGLFAMSSSHVAAFCKSSPELATPDIQFHILPATSKRSMKDNMKLELDRDPGLTIAPCQLRPESRGWVRIKSQDVRDHPAIMPNYLSAETDQKVVVEGLKWGRRIASQSPLKELVDFEMMPGDAINTDDELLAHARRAGNTIYHPVGTCEMGQGPDKPVDAELRVRGVSGLRVVDASIMPRIVSGNTNAPTIMIAEKASDIIRAG
ncbi:GMC family oxidoreductase [Novosphingobium malaysiense]|uniref:Choline dehydrogenase n=1 Tax=Novosphingobium malaysiense TaxID=1348853 RepID=A0A0B1ZM92_9SPHN|nr:GMC family oxidoreductase N-terminal domain-containing protein [Novosphingobium malaysiense]KHK90395.1 choline dehydrogenase [Novosphingobium malaysiense]